jgi:transposase-like protein
MPRQIFSDFDLGERIRQGKNVKEIAAEFGVSVQSVYKRTKKYNLNVSKDIAFHQAAAVNKQQINWSAQLLKINDSANQLLDRLIEVVQAQEGKERDQKLKGIEMLLGDKGSILDAAVKLKAEIRQQLKLLMDAWKQKYDIEQIAAFQKIFLDEVGKADPGVRDRIVERLKLLPSCLGWDLSLG